MVEASGEDAAGTTALLPEYAFERGTGCGIQLSWHAACEVSPAPG